MRDLFEVMGSGPEESEIIIDLFAGGGGASEGIRIATGRNPDAAVNHNPKAVAMHSANHPDTVHFTEDVWSVPPSLVTCGRPIGLLWASPVIKLCEKHVEHSFFWAFYTLIEILLFMFTTLKSMV